MPISSIPVCQQQPLDGYFKGGRTITNQLNRNSGNSIITSDPLDDYAQIRVVATARNLYPHSTTDEERLWVINGLFFSCKNGDHVSSVFHSTSHTWQSSIDRRASNDTLRSTSVTINVAASTAPALSSVNIAITRDATMTTTIALESCLPSSTSTSPSSVCASASFTKSTLVTSTPLSPPLSPTRTRPPLFKIESQELLSTRRPELGFRRSSSSNSLISLAPTHSRRSGPHRQQQQQQQQQEKLDVAPMSRVLRPILKKTRPVAAATTHRHQVHAHLGPLLQHQYQMQLQKQQQQQQQQQQRVIQQSSYSRDRPLLQRRTSPPHQPHLTSGIVSSPLSPPPILSQSPSATCKKAKEETRPLPTPPATKTVRWASQKEVLEIENIEDLIELGYYDDYDSEMGWDYRDENLDDDLSVSEDSDKDDLGSDFEAEAGEEEQEDTEGSELESPSEDELFEHMYRQRVLETDQTDGGEQEIDDVSSVAEDELIHRLASDQFLGSMWSPPSPLPSSLSTRPPLVRSPQHLPIAPPSSTLSSWSPQKYDGVSGIIQRFQSLEKQHSFSKGTAAASAAEEAPPASPPFPYPRRYNSSSQTDPLPSPSSLIPPSPTFSPLPLPLPASKSPRLDRAQILAEVAERKRNGAGAFAQIMVSRSLIALTSKLLSGSATTTATAIQKHVPLTGLFAVNKPTGLTSTTILDHLQHVCRRNQDHPLVRGVLEVDGSKRAKRGLVKIGHGGTLDPLARGIVVVGMGTGCKKLHKMSGSSKVYIAEGRLGFSSTTLDSTGSLVDQKPTDHVTKERLLDALQAFKGEISQTPPLYSALNMDGKRLYDYAREGIPLPREIPSRKVQIYGLDLFSYPDNITVPDPSLQSFGFQIDTVTPDSMKDTIQSTHASDDLKTTTTTTTAEDGENDDEEESKFRPKEISDPTLTDPNHIPVPSKSHGGLYFHIRVHCSSGTYIRTLIADIAAHLGTVGLMTDLLRVEQSGYRLGGEATLEMTECEDLERVEEAIQAGNRIWEERNRGSEE
ncbi:hypothetical protein BGX29_003133 [Mortierella sp. GBA35]|nr:hypothetical protein BGX29_003133 [Mortierella sp. GBA35]